MADAGQTVRYREVERLGAGGMATVTLAEDTLLGRPVALKRVHGAGSDPRGVLRLKREALVGASLNHPNIVSVYDARTQEDGDVVIVMEYVRGQTLSDLIRSRGALGPEEALRVLGGVASALDAIHARGIVHRDVKPANVLLGSEGAVKLADLGVADVADRTRITSSGAVVGSFSYMAPEQLEGAASSAAIDIYALAAVAYETLSGKRARPEPNPLALAHAINTQPPPDLRKVWPQAPQAAAAVLQRGMSADPNRRPPTAGELVRRLEEALRPEQPTAAAAGIGGSGNGADGAKPEPSRSEAAPIAAAGAAAAGAPPAGRAAVGAPASRAIASERRPQRAAVGTPARMAMRTPGQAAGPASQEVRQSPAAHAPAVHPPRAIPVRRRTWLLPALVALAALVIAAVVIVAVSSGGTKRSPAADSAKGSPKASRSHSSGSVSSAAGATQSTTSSSALASGGSAGSTSASSGSSANSPVGAVEKFYEAAAQHQYSTAWALADPNLRAQLGGYSSFEGTFSRDRSITFHSATVMSRGSRSATVALQTTSLQTNTTQQCAGTAQTVQSGGTWLVDHVSINCS